MMDQRMRHTRIYAICKDGFDKTIRGIELLKKYKIDVKINGSLVKKNFHDRMEIIDIGEKYDIPVRDRHLYVSIRA